METILALDPGLSLGWATNSTAYHRGQSGVFKVDEWVRDWFDGRKFEGDDKLARRLASVARWLDQIAHCIVPDLIVVERQLNMGSSKRPRSIEVNREIETVCIELAGNRDILLLRPAPNSWQAWARRGQLDRLNAWNAAGKPDEESARMILAWAMETVNVEPA